MSHAQWLFMAQAFAQKECTEREDRNLILNEVFTAAQRYLRELLINLLGLNIGAGAGENGQPSPFIPMIVTMAKAEVMEELLKRHEAETNSAPMTTTEENELHDDLLSMDLGDVFDAVERVGEKKKMTKDSIEFRNLMRAMGVEIEGA